MLKDPKKENIDIIDIDLSPIRKKRFRINGDDDRILELNVSDLNIFARLQEAYPKLEELSKLAAEKLPDYDDNSDDTDFVPVLKEIDEKMREQLDFIFNSNISEICAPEGSMYDPFNGKLRYEHILETISALYENNFNSEVKKMSQRVTKHTAKYTKSRKK